MLPTWNDEDWKKRFKAMNSNYRSLRKEVWENTKAVVENNGYVLSDGKSVLLRQDLRKNSSFYFKEFTPDFEPNENPVSITIFPKDCLDAAHDWVKHSLTVSVLNLASRRNPEMVLEYRKNIFSDVQIIINSCTVTLLTHMNTDLSVQIISILLILTFAAFIHLM